MSFSADNVDNFKLEIKKIQDDLQQLVTKDTTDEIVKFENQHTLNELNECLSSSASEKELEENLKKFLADRWDRIRNSTAAYTQQPLNKVNALCLELANTLAPLPADPADYDGLGLGEGPYFLLMPSLKAHQSVSYENIHRLKLHEFILSDNGELYIPVIACLHHAFVSDEGEMTQMISEPNLYQFPKLTPNELSRIKEHSPEVKKYYELIQEYNKERLGSLGLASQLGSLVVALRRGGAHGGEGGQEYDSGALANQGIAVFAEFWNTYPEEKKQEAYRNYPDLEDILGRLMRPTAAEYRAAIYCVEILAGELAPIVSACRSNERAIVDLKYQIEDQQEIVTSAMERPDYQVSSDPAVKQPKVLHQIFKLDESQQKAIFKHAANQNGLLYALEFEPLALPQFFNLFKDNEAAKQLMISARFAHNDTALIIAAKEGGKESVALLLEAGVEVEARDNNGSTALHWAAYNGQNEVVAHLITNNAQIEASGDWGNTALHFAVYQKHDLVVATLLKNGANITTRNNNGENALDRAIREHPKSIEPLLLKAITLSSDQQSYLLRRVSGGIYPDVMTYALAHQPHMVKSLLIQASALSEEEQQSCLSNIEGGPYGNVLLYAMCEQPNAVNDLLTATGKMDQSNNGLKEMAKFFDIDSHIELFKEKLKEMEIKERKNHRYAPAVSQAKEFIRELTLAKGEFLLNVNPGNLEELNFSKVLLKERCLDATTKARPVLEKHREWGKYIAAFILTVITFPISVPLLALGVFSLKSDSVKKLEQFKNKVQGLDITESVSEEQDIPDLM